MKLKKDRSAPLDDRTVAVALALEQSHEVKAKVEACAEDLASANDATKKKIAGGTATLSAPEALAEGERVESQVQECAEDLEAVTGTLAQGIEELKRVETALVVANQALASTEAQLVAAQTLEREARHQAHHDSTTGLPNRDLFNSRVAHAISLANRHGWTLAVMFFDLDDFKRINDTHGHSVGDFVLKEVANRLLAHARKEDTVCRNGGDEFLYLLVNPQGRENIERVADAVLGNIARPIEAGKVAHVIRSSIGIAIYPNDGRIAEQLIRNADAAMYRAKKGDTGYAFFGALQPANAPTRLDCSREAADDVVPMAAMVPPGQSSPDHPRRLDIPAKLEFDT